MEDGLEIRAGTPRDLEWLRPLLTRAGLPVEDAEVMLPDGLLVARVSGAPVGAVGLQAAGRDGLLRSLVVAPPARGRGVATRLVAEVETLAAGRGIGRLYLLTATAATFFARLGYVAAERAAVPPPIAATAEFGRLCPASAACLTKSLEG